MNPRNPPPNRGGSRPPRHLCTRRPVSSEATGRQRGQERGSRKRKRRTEPQLPRRPPFPSVSSSSSSFFLLRFPAVVSGCFSGPGFGSRSGVLRAACRPPFERVQVSENRVCLRDCSGAVRRPVRPASHPSALPRSASAKPGPGSSGCSRRRPGFRFTTRFRPPVPLVCCSFRSWFVSRFVFSSFQFSSDSLASACSARFFCSVQSRSFPFVLPFRSVCLRFVRSELILCVLRPLTGDLLYISRVYYTLIPPKIKCIFS